MTNDAIELPPVVVGPLDDLEPGTTTVVSGPDAGTDDDIVIIRDEDGSVWALDDTCTHAEASLAEGEVEDGEIECPLHAGRFDVRTGKALCLPLTRDTRTHRVEVVDGEIVLHPRAD